MGIKFRRHAQSLALVIKADAGESIANLIVRARQKAAIAIGDATCAWEV